MRPPTDDEIAELKHEVSSLDVRARGRLDVVRVACPSDVDPDALVDALEAALSDTPLRHVDVLTQVDDGAARVLGGLFS